MISDIPTIISFFICMYMYIMQLILSYKLFTSLQFTDVKKNDYRPT